MTGPWTISYRKGDVYSHRRTTKFMEHLPNGQDVVRLELRAIERTEVKDVNAKGEATLAATCLSMDSLHGGTTERINATSYPSVTRVFGRNGLLIREIDATDTGRDPLELVDRLLLNRPTPPESVDNGSVWRTDLPDARRPGKRVTIVSRYLGTTTSLKIPAIKVTEAFDVDHVPPRTEAIHVKCEMALDPATGRTIKATTEIKNVAFAAHGGIVPGEVSIEEELIVPGVNDKESGAPPN